MWTKLLILGVAGASVAAPLALQTAQDEELSTPPVQVGEQTYAPPPIDWSALASDDRVQSPGCVDTEPMRFVEPRRDDDGRLLAAEIERYDAPDAAPNAPGA